jgi:hypothetical protein
MKSRQLNPYMPRNFGQLTQCECLSKATHLLNCALCIHSSCSVTRFMTLTAKWVGASIRTSAETLFETIESTRLSWAICFRLLAPLRGAIVIFFDDRYFVKWRESISCKKTERCMEQGGNNGVYDIPVTYAFQPTWPGSCLIVLDPSIHQVCVS